MKEQIIRSGSAARGVQWIMSRCLLVFSVIASYLKERWVPVKFSRILCLFTKEIERSEY